MIELGTSYAHFDIPPGIFHPESICYFAGVGEDFIFDCEFVQRFGCKGFLIDPTPRAKIHFEKVKEDPTISSIPKSKDHENYSQFEDVLDFFTYCDFGLAACSEVLQFYPPNNLESVSHSIDNIKRTDAQRGFSAQCYTLQDTMQLLGHEKLDFLKMNIEGAELEILYEIVREKIPVKVIAVDFDYLKRDFSSCVFPSRREMILFLKTAGFELESAEGKFTFINRRL